MTQQDLFDYLNENLTISLSEGSMSYSNERENGYVGFKVALYLTNPSTRKSVEISNDRVDIHTY